MLASVWLRAKSSNNIVHEFSETFSHYLWPKQLPDALRWFKTNFRE